MDSLKKPGCLVEWLFICRSFGIRYLYLLYRFAAPIEESDNIWSFAGLGRRGLKNFGSFQKYVAEAMDVSYAGRSVVALPSVA